MTHLLERFSTASLLAADEDARVLRPTLGAVGLHWHDYYELSLVLSGSAVHAVNGESRVVGPGSAFLLSPADLHSIAPLGEEPLDCYNTVIDPVLVEAQLRDVVSAGTPGFPWHSDDCGDMEADLRRLQEETEVSRWAGAQARRALVTCLLVELGRRCRPGGGLASASSATDAAVRSAVVFVDRHFREPLTLSDAASRAHLSPNYFSERFRLHTGTSFQQYLQERRLRFARALLASSPSPSTTVTEVCHAAGFNSLSHFGRAYRRRFGVSPSSDASRARTASR